MIRIPRIRIRHTGVADPYFLPEPELNFFLQILAPDPKRVRFGIRLKAGFCTYLYPNLKVSNPPDSKKTQLFNLRLRSENLNKVPV